MVQPLNDHQVPFVHQICGTMERIAYHVGVESARSFLCLSV
jgi:hypothetical protein